MPPRWKHHDFLKKTQMNLLEVERPMTQSILCVFLSSPLSSLLPTPASLALRTLHPHTYNRFRAMLSTDTP